MKKEEANYVQIGDMIKCGACCPSDFIDCKELKKKLGFKCQCQCHSKEAEQKELKKFLRESNYIENERSHKAHEDAYKAWRFLENFDELTVSRILEVHNVLMKRLNPRIAGRIRNCDVRVGYKVCPSYLQVGELLDKWLERHSKAKTEEEIRLAHVVFEGVHPFEDSNGRTGRIIMNWQRVKNGLPLLVIKESEKQDYYKWFDN